MRSSSEVSVSGRSRARSAVVCGESHFTTCCIVFERNTVSRPLPSGDVSTWVWVPLPSRPAASRGLLRAGAAGDAARAGGLRPRERPALPREGRQGRRTLLSPGPPREYCRRLRPVKPRSRRVIATAPGPGGSGTVRLRQSGGRPRSPPRWCSQGTGRLRPQGLCAGARRAASPPPALRGGSCRGRAGRRRRSP